MPYESWRPAVSENVMVFMLYFFKTDLLLLKVGAYMVGKLWISPSIWRQAIEIWRILPAVRILLTRWNINVSLIWELVLWFFQKKLTYCGLFYYFIRGKIGPNFWRLQITVENFIDATLTIDEYLVLEVVIWVLVIEVVHDTQECHIWYPWIPCFLKEREKWPLHGAGYVKDQKKH